jgi:hypothetical protein
MDQETGRTSLGSLDPIPREMVGSAVMPERRVQAFGPVLIGGIDGVGRADYPDAGIDRRVEQQRCKIPWAGWPSETAGRAGERVAHDPDHPTVFSVAKNSVCSKRARNVRRKPSLTGFRQTPPDTRKLNMQSGLRGKPHESKRMVTNLCNSQPDE